MIDLELKIHLAQDEETGRWYIAESDIPGLWLEAETAADLVRRIELAAPEMIELNAREIIGRFAGEELPLEPHVQSRRRLAYRPVFDSPMLACA